MYLIFVVMKKKECVLEVVCSVLENLSLLIEIYSTNLHSATLIFFRMVW